MNKYTYNFVKIFYTIPVALCLGAVINFVLFFTIAFLFAGADGDKWVRSYFGGDGEYFLTGAFFISIVAFPFLIKLNIVLSKK
jgi:hypothetical protein